MLSDPALGPSPDRVDVERVRLIQPRPLNLGIDEVV